MQVNPPASPLTGRRGGLRRCAFIEFSFGIFQTKRTAGSKAVSEKNSGFSHLFLTRPFIVLSFLVKPGKGVGLKREWLQVIGIFWSGGAPTICAGKPSAFREIFSKWPSRLAIEFTKAEIRAGSRRSTSSRQKTAFG